MSRFFRTADTSVLHPHRREHLERMAESMLDFAQVEANGHDYAVDMVLDDDELWQSWENENKSPETDAFDSGGEGRLDLLGMLIQEGVEPDRITDFYGFDEGGVGEILNDTGLHGIHFRMDLPSFQDRMFYTSLVLSHFKDGYAHYALNTLSMCMDDDAEAAVNGYDYFDTEDNRYRKLSDDQIYTLFRLDSRKAPTWTQEAYFAAIDYYLEPKTSTFAEMASSWPAEVDDQTATDRIEQAFHHLVYNLGYRLKNMGYDNVTIMDEVSPTIDYLMAKVTQDKEFAEGIKRQVLINLFSAFPAGLKLLNTQPEELQGITLDPRILGHQMQSGFRDTLLGPMALFCPHTTLQTKDCVVSIMRFLEEAGYKVSFDVAYKAGFGVPQQVSIIQNSRHPMPLIAENGAELIKEGGVPFSWGPVLNSLLLPSVLGQYDDQVVVDLILAAGSHIESTPLKSPKLTGIPTLESLDGMMKDRPALKKLLLDQAADSGALSFHLFHLVGGNAEDLRALGKKAPSKLRDSYLSADLGI